MTERIAIIDVGSNSARLIVMCIYANGAYNLIYQQKETLRLGEGRDGANRLRAEAVQRTVETMQIFAHMCQLLEVTAVLAVATAAIRNAENGPELLRSIQDETGIELKVISGQDEARLGFGGVVNTLEINDAVLFDVGGGSTELTLIRDRRPAKMVSLPLGAVTLTEQFGTRDQIGELQLAKLRKFILRHLAKVPWLTDSRLPLVGIGGTARNIAKVDQKRKNYPLQKVHNYRLGNLSLEDLWRALVAADFRQRAKIPGLSSERADIIVAGASIVKSLFDVTGADRLIVGGFGVREGLFFRHYLHSVGQPEIIDDILRHSTHNMLLFYKGNIAHAYHVADLADAMFAGWQPLHGLDGRDRELLQVAALLHDIGITINYYDHSRHSAYLVENARLFGLTHREQMLAAVVAGWHNGPSAKSVRNRLYSELLDETDWLKARKLALLLALAESLDKTEMGLVRRVTAGTGAGGASLELDLAPEGAPLELQEVAQHGRWFKKELGQGLTWHFGPA